MRISRRFSRLVLRDRADQGGDSKSTDIGSGHSSGSGSSDNSNGDSRLFGPPFFTSSSPNLRDFQKLCSQTARLSDYPLASSVEKNIPIYCANKLMSFLKSASSNSSRSASIKAEEESDYMIRKEWVTCLRDGPGVFALTNAYGEYTHSIIDRTTHSYLEIMKEEKSKKQNGKGDHFGKNERLWNSIQKLCIKDPSLFAQYFGNSFLALACRAWLGLNYQITSQVNNILPQGRPQTAHRDFHLGFQSDDKINYFPSHTQISSQFLTLQGLIAHTDMPRESGPTRLLPFSQNYGPGYMAYRLPEFAQFFEENYVDLPLNKGDMVFFSPALFHAGGENSTNNIRFGNLVQVSSCMGRAMEVVDRHAMLLALYPVLLNEYDVTDPRTHDVIAACGESYSFPTNLDLDPPLGQFAPETPASLCVRGLTKKWTVEIFTSELNNMTARRNPYTQKR